MISSIVFIYIAFPTKLVKVSIEVAERKKVKTKFLTHIPNYLFNENVSTEYFQTAFLNFQTTQ